jgi:hypothetical protein
MKITYLKHLIIIFLLPVIFGGCKKDDITPTTLTKTQILVKYTWQVDEVFRNSSGKNTHYIKGGINTTGSNYGVVRLIFKADGTATYTDDQGNTYSATWRFTTADEKNMELAINSSSNVKYTWNMVEIYDKVFTNTTSVIGTSSDVLVVARYVPIP